MWRRLLRWLAPLALGLACSLPVAAADPPGDSPDKQHAEPIPALQYVAAFVFLILILLILCKPSRKSYEE
jgi:hypothetical protein